MSVLLRGTVRRKERGARPSVREVCLLGTSGEAWASGERVTWSGRRYRVEATQACAGDGPGYVYLSSEGEG